MENHPENIPPNLPEDLADKWLKGDLTPEEQAIFDQWYEAHPDQTLIVDASSREAFQKLMLRNIKGRSGMQQKENSGAVVKIKWLVVAAAASIVIAFGLFKYLNRPQGNMDASMRIAQMVEPGGNKALLTLASGQTITLDDAQNGVLYNQGNVTISKADTGLLTYKTSGDITSGAISFNTLSTPRGGKYSLVLPDGTSVWLNASSSIRYPTAFAGHERKVTITGEAYFEVVHNEKMPFRVQIGKVTVEDIGTHFVINGYSDEPAVKVSLLEGAVKVIGQHASNSRVLQPGWQASVDKNGTMQVAKDADIEGEIAWKNGLFNFSGSDLKSIMRQLQRWYNIQVVYAPGLPDYHFGGQTYMNVSLSEVLKVLALNGIHFSVVQTNNQQPVKIIIKP